MNIAFVIVPILFVALYLFITLNGQNKTDDFIEEKQRQAENKKTKYGLKDPKEELDLYGVKQGKTIRENLQRLTENEASAESGGSYPMVGYTYLERYNDYRIYRNQRGNSPIYIATPTKSGSGVKDDSLENLKEKIDGERIVS